MRGVETGVATGDGALASHLKTRWLFNAKVTLIHMDRKKVVSRRNVIVSHHNEHAEKEEIILRHLYLKRDDVTPPLSNKTLQRQIKLAC